MPPICKFWQQGTCRNGNNCRFEHPGAGSSRPPPNPNRYAPLQNSEPSRSNNGYRSQPSATAAPAYGLEKAAIVIDLSSEKPQWILSAYGPGRAAPAQLFGGPQREQSFEELRLLHYIGVAAGNIQPAVQEAERIYQAADQQMQTALNDVDGAINYIISAENNHPNRIDICRESQAASAGSQRGIFQRNQEYPIDTRSQPLAVPGFGAPAQPAAFGQPTGGAFGQASALGQKANPFGAPSGGAFGQPSGGAFGQTSALGQKPNPFGASAPAFGAPTQLGSGGAFGQPSALGQKPSPFGAPSGAFGQPSGGGAFGQSSASGLQPNPFGGQPAAPAAFGNPSQPQANPFGAPSVQNPSPFGAPTPVSQPNPFGNTPAPFGAPSPAPKNPFGAPSQPTPSPFGGSPISQPNPFGAAPAPAPAAANPFGNPQPASQPVQNPFGNTQSTPAGFSNPPPAQAQVQPQSYTNGTTSLTEHPSLEQYSTRDGNGQLLTWKNKRVVYKEGVPGTQNFDGTWAKIWFPDGPPVPDKWAEADPELYTEDVKHAYENAKKNGVFDGGIIPLIPPKQEWCQWDF